MVRTYVILILILLIGCTPNLGKFPSELEQDLKHYPYFFFDEGQKFNSVIIIDEFSSAEDNESALDLLDYFRQYDSTIDQSFIKVYPDYFDLEASNAILIGSCAQEPHNKFVNIYVDCLSIKDTQAIIRIIDHRGKWLLYVIGATPEMTKNAVDVLTHYKKYKLSGVHVEVVPSQDGYIIREPT